MTRDPSALWKLFDVLWNDVTPDQSFFASRPLLAHYTSMSTFEKIVANNEVWFANPLFMNDVEEVRFGINEGMNSLLRNAAIRQILGSNHPVFESSLLDVHQQFDTQHAFDTYVLCLSEHDEDDRDGMLSMWRGYGDAGRGVAIVFDARALSAARDTPLIVSKVVYGTREQRLEWLDGLGRRYAQVVAAHPLSPDDIPLSVAALFTRLRTFSLFTKHWGFREEREWRLAYLPERDPEGILRPHLSYFNGPRGVEPKLKLPVSPIPALSSASISLETLIREVILGPTMSSILALNSAKRMLHHLGRASLADRVVASRIPYRP